MTLTETKNPRCESPKAILLRKMRLDEELYNPENHYVNVNELEKI